MHTLMVVLTRSDFYSKGLPSLIKMISDKAQTQIPKTYQISTVVYTRDADRITYLASYKSL